MAYRGDLAGAAHLVLADGVAYLDPATAMYRAMLEGWEIQQRSRMLKKLTIKGRVRLIERFMEYADLYPWQWTPQELEAFSASLDARFTTLRSYQGDIRLFLDYVTDPRYGWVARCEEQFGHFPVQICDEWNTVAHRDEYEGRPERRALTYDELDALFEAADLRVEAIAASGRKGAMAAFRDSAMLRCVYAYGLRRAETVWLDLVDLRRNPKMPRYGSLGAVQVRYGKSAGGGPPRRRTVLTVPEMDWAVASLRQWINEVRPCFRVGSLPALWVTERRGRMRVQRLDEIFQTVRELAGLDEDLDLHCLRHSYVTHLLEYGYPELFVQKQVGHAYASTTAIYSSVSDEFRNRLLQGSLRRQMDDGGLTL